MLAAFAFWAEQNIKEITPDARQRIAAICSRIRFPAIPSHILDNYYTCHSFMRTFDPNRELLFRAVRRQQSLVCRARQGFWLWLNVDAVRRSLRWPNHHGLHAGHNSWQTAA